MAQYRFVPAPEWPVPPEGWSPPKGWTPDPAWPAAPVGWNFWVLEEEAAADSDAISDDSSGVAVEPMAEVVAITEARRPIE
jgi:hypothetical protein